MSASQEKVDPRVKRTHQLLQKALIELLKEKEFRKITVQDITERAGVNRATFYDRYEDKFALLNAWIKEDFQARLDAKISPGARLTLDNLRLLILTACDYLKGFIGHCAPSTHHDEQMIMVLQVQRTIHETILKWSAHSANPPRQAHVPPEMVATVMSTAIVGSVMEWAMNGRKVSAEQLTDQILFLLTSGPAASLI
jgi:AcrR family transcriptional regulator